MELLSVYIPMDRRQALASGKTLPDRMQGAALFADISGFTPLTERLALELGPQRGAEELTRHLNIVYDALIAELHRFGGSVIGFSGDAITCWFARDSGLRATACALAMQNAMRGFSKLAIPSGGTVSLAMKAAVASGPARRFLVGDPEIQVIDVLAGAILDHLAAAEHQARKGEVVLDQSTAIALGEQLDILAWCEDHETSRRAAVISGLKSEAPDSSWGPFETAQLTVEQVRPWLLPPVYKRLHKGQGEFLAELRPAIALFLRFTGIDYDRDDASGEKLDTYIRQMQRILARFEAHIIQLTIGDKGSYLCAAFGAPLAHEDDAVRAASAALELRDLIQSLDFISSVQIGISQGRMRTGAYGSATHRTYGMQGDDVNLAARLMQTAEPGQILASKPLRQAIPDGFSWEGLPEIRVKGKAEPVKITALLGKAARSKTLRLQEPRYALPMVGREMELALVASKMGQALEGRGQIVAISAEAGMGKSRLLAEAVRLPASLSLAGYAGECQSYGTNTSYLVWQNIWRGFFGLEADWPFEQQVQALERQLNTVSPSLVMRLPLLGAVLNLSIPDNDLTRNLDAKLRKTSLEALLVDCVRARVKETPLLFILEDCHWIDPLSNDLLEAIARAAPGLPVLILLAFRPPAAQGQLAPPLKISQLENFSEIQLKDFTAQEAERLIRLKLEQFFGEQMAVSAAFVDRITNRAEGNPFYIEELLNYLQDRRINPNDSQALETLDLPTSLHSLILSRIDQLAESQKITLKIASVIGRLFKAAMLWGVYAHSWEWEQVRADLGVLQQSDMLALDSPEPELTYLFKNIVTQEVAYESLPFATRAMLHEQIAQYIEKTSADNLEQHVYLLAFHYDHSQNEPKQREYLLRAAQLAQATYANTAAINYYQRVLPLLPAAERAPAMRKLAKVFELVGSWEEASELLHKALQLADELGDRSAQAWCQLSVGELLRKRGSYAEAELWLGRAQESLGELGDQAGVGQALHIAGSLAAQQGDYDLARALYQQSLEIRRQLDDKPLIASLLSNLGIVARFQGDYSLARSLHEEGLAIRHNLGDRWAIANSLNNLGNVALDQGLFAEARARLEEAVSLQREIGDKYYIANALNNLGNVVRAQGDFEAARALYTESLELNRELGDGWQLAYVLEDMGCLAALQGSPQRALRLVGAASQLRDKIGAPRSPAEESKLESMLEPARQALDAEAQQAAWQEGYRMSLEQALDYALQLAGEPAL